MNTRFAVTKQKNRDDNLYSVSNFYRFNTQNVFFLLIFLVIWHVFYIFAYKFQEKETHGLDRKEKNTSDKAETT